MDEWGNAMLYSDMEGEGAWRESYVNSFEVGGRVNLELNANVWKGIRNAVKSDPRFDSNASLIRHLVGRGLTEYQNTDGAIFDPR